MIGFSFRWGSLAADPLVSDLAGNIAAGAIIAVGVTVQDRAAVRTAGKFLIQILGVRVIASMTGECIDRVELCAAIRANIFGRHWGLVSFRWREILWWVSAE
jgi:hypothetical protein